MEDVIDGNGRVNPARTTQDRNQCGPNEADPRRDGSAGRMSLELLQAATPIELRPSKDFADALQEPATA